MGKASYLGKSTEGAINPRLDKIFGLGTTGQWVKLGKGVLGRVMPLSIVVVLFEAVCAVLLAAVARDHLPPFIYTALAVDFLMFLIAFLWAHLHPVEAASEGREIAQIRHVEASFATKSAGAVLPAENVEDPRLLRTHAAHTIGEITADAHATLVEQPALPKPTVSVGRKKSK